MCKLLLLIPPPALRCSLNMCSSQMSSQQMPYFERAATFLSPKQNPVSRSIGSLHPKVSWEVLCNPRVNAAPCALPEPSAENRDVAGCITVPPADSIKCRVCCCYRNLVQQLFADQLCCKASFSSQG